MYSTLDQSFSQYLTSSNISLPAQEHKLEQKNQMIEFYLEEKVRREELHADEERMRIKEFEKVVENMEYLLRVEEERERMLRGQIDILRSGNT